MEARTLLIATILSAGVSFSLGACSQTTHHGDAYNSDTRAAESDTHTDQGSADPRLVANRFIKHVNYARLELAMNHPDLAKQHIAKARNMATMIGDSTAEQQNIEDVKSGRLTLTYDRSYEEYYFPLETGSINGVKQRNPLWIQKGAPITDAEIVYLTLNINNEAALKRLNEAETAIDNGDFKDADVHLAKLSADAITADNEDSMPVEKARDNIALARRFIMDENYDGARYALTHADKSLNEMQKDNAYRAHRRHIIAMRNQIKDMRTAIAKNNPSMMQKADAKLAKWWNELKDWAHA